MNAQEALRQIKDLAFAGLVEFTDHARREMRDECTDEREVVLALLEGDSCEESRHKKERWIVGCSSLGLSVACAFHSSDGDEVVVVVTVFGRSED